jgi:PPOX class probable F420-dependent enzyme
MIDLATEFGARADRRLREEKVAWFITVRPDGTPIPVPVWFLWDGETILVYGQPHTGKLRNLAQNPRAALHLRTDEHANDVIVLTGRAVVDRTAPPADKVPQYQEKYRQLIAALGMTPDEFAASYAVAIRFVPDRISGF